MSKEFSTEQEVISLAESVIKKILRSYIPVDRIQEIESKIDGYGNKRKGHFGELVEEFIFEQKNNNDPGPDLKPVGIELKTTPLKKMKTKKFAPKERLVFSMIDYKKMMNETWESSSFLKKNKKLLILFYLYLDKTSVLDYRFEFFKYLDLLEDLAKNDVAQIKKDWEFITSSLQSLKEDCGVFPQTLAGVLCRGKYLRTVGDSSSLQC
jgi:DNA mismatch repair protein MutH